MGLPKTIKYMNVYADGDSFLGESSEVTLPKLARKIEDWRGGGHDAALGVDLGGEALEFEWKAGGFLEKVYTQFGAASVNALQLRFVGSIQDDGTGQVKTIDITVRGRHQEIDPGSAKGGEIGETTTKTRCAYYKLMVDGRTLIEKDELNMVFIVNGVDRLAQHRAALGI
ncbi:phage major tail tube protein [Altericroceibacterium endophyticum]|uniref:Phage major tail tube protein n=1 Tax=Altericroceibacterium endophyticum TaxID=1808508 RepID=A0A6I4T832_9SPHN|nr:phage major tail tube protein [Altericroceibacterium endophyticum]MXO66261.1 phage major tail tube protein [Altericroceibacterium endophyticum]